MYNGIRELEMVFHAYSDSLSPSHSGFQTWWGPIDRVKAFGAARYVLLVKTHGDGETMQIFLGMWRSVVDSVKGQFQKTLDEVLRE